MAASEAVTNAVLHGGRVTTAAPAGAEDHAALGSPIPTGGPPAPERRGPSARGRRESGADVLTVTLAVEDRWARIAVTSPRTGWTMTPPPAVLPDLMAQGGRGFFVIQCFTDAWGVEQNPDGTTVTLSRRLPGPPAEQRRTGVGRRGATPRRRPRARRPGHRTA